MMQIPRRAMTSSITGSGIAPQAPPPPLQFAPMAPPDGGGGGPQPNISPLIAALQQKMSESASPSSRATDSPMRKKPAIEDLFGMAQGGFANA